MKRILYQITSGWVIGVILAFALVSSSAADRRRLLLARNVATASGGSSYSNQFDLGLVFFLQTTNAYSDAGTTLATVDATTTVYWKDESGNGNHLTKPTGTAPVFRTLQKGSIPAMTYASSGYWTNLQLSPRLTNQYAITIVVKTPNGSGSFAGVFDGVNANSRRAFYKDNAERWAFSDNGAGPMAIGTNQPLTTATWYYITAIQSNTAAYLYVNGSLVTNVNTFANTNALDTFLVGTLNGFGNGWGTAIGDMWAWTNAPTSLMISNSHWSVTNRWGATGWGL